MTDVLAPQSHVHKSRAVAILRALYPAEEIAAWTAWFANWRLNEVMDVLDERPVPTLSRADRLRIENAAREIA